MKNCEFVLLEKHDMEVVCKYKNLKSLFKGLYWKKPDEYWVGNVKTGQVYTISQIKEIYIKQFSNYKDFYMENWNYESRKKSTNNNND